MRFPSDNLPLALDRWDDLREEIGRRTPALFLDYDGTLTPIVKRPELAVLSDEMRATVRRLATHLPVAVVSGRDIKDVKALVRIDEIVYAGSHGYQIEKPGEWQKELDEAAQFLPSLERVANLLSDSLAAVDGATVERKGYSVVAHYRLAAQDDIGRVKRAVDQAAEACPDLKPTEGKKIYEFVPDFEWNKGKALLWLRETLQLDDRYCPIFIGDDVTDEFAFGAVEEDGIGILVRDEARETKARYALDSVEEVRSFLAVLSRSFSG